MSIEAGPAPRCPDQSCGAPMQLKLARRGRNAGGYFWSCTRYPACRETRPYEGSAGGTGAADGDSGRPEPARVPRRVVWADGTLDRLGWTLSLHVGRWLVTRVPGIWAGRRIGVPVLDRPHGGLRRCRHGCRACRRPAEEDHPARHRAAARPGIRARPARVGWAGGRSRVGAHTRRSQRPPRAPHLEVRARERDAVGSAGVRDEALAFDSDEEELFAGSWANGLGTRCPLARAAALPRRAGDGRGAARPG